MPQPACIGKSDVADADIFVSWDVRGKYGVGLVVLLRCIRSSIADLNKVISKLFIPALHLAVQLL